MSKDEFELTVKLNVEQLKQSDIMTTNGKAMAGADC